MSYIRLVQIRTEAERRLRRELLLVHVLDDREVQIRTEAERRLRLAVGVHDFCQTVFDESKFGLKPKGD